DGNTAEAAGAADAMGTRTDGGHRLNGIWPSVPRGRGAGGWSVVRALVPSPDAPDAPPVPYRHVVRARQWRALPARAGDDGSGPGALVDAFVPSGLVAPVPPEGRPQEWPGDAALVGSASLSLGLAGAALELAKGSDAFGPAGRPGAEGPFLVEQQFSDVELAVLDAAHRLRTAVEDCVRAARADGDGTGTAAGAGGDGTTAGAGTAGRAPTGTGTRGGDRFAAARAGLADVMRSASSVAQLAVAFAYEFSIDSDEPAVREAMARLAAAAAPALLNSRFAGEFLELASARA
ncbi:hypothetical protein L1885_27425, partial [Streptomyces fuscigenes]